ncbi:hypothetical protein ACFV6E_04755 [Streptomyces sp. NPDC059785]|uniref:hypothetical protein n=1 Tax=unclassified Streptomyces TaxID=2593676 RepID=UPI003661556B
MPRTRELLGSITTATPLSTEVLAQAVDVLAECEQVATACAIGMLGEKDADAFRTAIGHCQDCADVSAATRRILVRGSSHDAGLLRAQVEACRIACKRSNDACKPHAQHHEHCRLCVETTGRTMTTCDEVLAAVRS